MVDNDHTSWGFKNEFPGVKIEEPSKQNILKAMDAPMEDVKAGDPLLFAFTGHGTESKDEDGDEITGNDQAICPLSNEYILEDELYEVLFKNLPKGGRLTALFD